jgi:hypothetical protein
MLLNICGLFTVFGYTVDGWRKHLDPFNSAQSKGRAEGDEFRLLGLVVTPFPGCKCVLHLLAHNQQ